ncbi:PREDICTED: uncharacterized protein LOC108364262 isoform X1 [Rhagoletis zephyria]|uniref:uncharacterized protein LOC108364262 isoform X1 n=1 Tax=Rhagoletis zephyria TaxID=28612 RepID=UPI0008117F2C|nr:PREDICTED: uncharacterized protein LOC108364262 isoform X1 [Rhagoletis zephyria]
MHQSAVKQYSMEYKSHNDQLENIHHASYRSRRHHVDIYVNLPKPVQQWTVVLIALILLQYADLYTCHHIPTNERRTSQNNDGSRDYAHYLRNRADPTEDSHSSSSNFADRFNDSESDEVGKKQSAVRKRRIGSGQPEEIFSLDDRIETSYDEYPMVVPKRAALLLDRLMVALHHALEQERGKLSDFYAGRNDKYDKTKAGSSPGSDDDSEQMTANHMYSDDDPSVLMDYDFKDLNSINRATGETLMAKSFQRRGSMGLDLGGDLGNAEGVAMLTAAAAATTDDNAGGLGGGGVGRNGIGNGGRMYWRCYFNAVSCF